MPSHINEIAKETLIKLKERKLHPTPENYSEVFEECARKAGVISFNKARIEKYTNLLDDTYKQELKRKSIRTIDEFLMFLVSRLNRQVSRKYEDVYALLDLIIQQLGISKDKKIKELAQITQHRLSQAMDIETIYLLRAKWKELEKSYEDGELLKKLEEFNIRAFLDFYSLVERLIAMLKERSYEKQAELLLLSLEPLFGESKELEQFRQSLKDNPKLIARKEFAHEYCLMLQKKEAIDKYYIQKNLSFFNQHLESLNEMVSKLYNNSQEDVKFINALAKDENGNVQVNFDTLKDKLLYANEQIAQIKTQIQATSDDEQREQWNLAQELKKLDENYRLYAVNYALCFFKVDNIEHVINTYGIDSFKTISVKFKKTLKDLCKNIGEIWILDESSYLIILPGKNLEEAQIFTEKALKMIDDYKFIYKEEVVKLVITSSCIEKKEFPDGDILKELIHKA
ncbi:hypothetical protein CSUB8523_1314 [Campylobacter subantarcticus LMG 24377]|uniref:GGDEF domain-containing protein n=1 Tax=Campylobacter subantarcticus TaxID=497724 RepID=A0ABW9N4Z2_9BACT|nr:MULTISPECIES: hypothetical protein [Campylobacter]AJC92818.1 hypothetical protein CSUB8523_1314 [Campylobacter subantarcticus LMG 24377]EAL3938242.1 hypothetical protein [Campylobacter lari]MPB99168.1 hypothetical protein [Campylobacter subantarcticus]QOR00698.1 hypothetical protein A0083_05450 [Campylobacter sp. 2014D-0216]